MQKVKLNIVPKGVKKTTYLSQNDNGRVVRYELFNELIPYILDGSETITLKVVRPDGEEILANIENTFEGEAYIDVSFNDDMSAITGVGAGEIKITDGETELGSHNFDINVEIDAYNGKDVVIETETGTLLSFNTEVEDNALEYESEIPYNAAGYTGLRVINSRSTPVYDKTPYLFRKTPSGYGNSCIEKLNGLTVAFNQIIPTANKDFTNTQTDTKTFLSIQIVSLESPSQLYGMYNYTQAANTCVLLKPSTVTKGLRIKHNGSQVEMNLYRDDNASLTANHIYIFNIKVESTDPTTLGGIITKNLMIIDLTQMFGSTIADYIYSLETAQAGAGVAYFKSLFGADYYEYNAGELMSVKTSGRKTIGFNQWDEEWELGWYNTSTGAKGSDNTRIRCKNFIHCVPSTTYYSKSPNQIICLWYDANKTYLGSYQGVNANTTFTIPSNCYYFTFYVASAYGTTYNHDICINISDPERNGQYEPYNAVTYPLDPDLELRGIPSLDANNKLYGDGDTYESNGDVKRRYGIIDLGSFTWVYHGEGNDGGNVFYGVSQDFLRANNARGISLIPVMNFSGWRNTLIGTINLGHSQLKIIGSSATITNAAAFKASLSGVYLIYEKETPTSESADPFDNPQEVKVTEEFIDDRAIPIPVGQDSIYGTDIEYQDIDFDTTIYGGEIDAVNGVLSSEYNSDGSVKPTPEIIDITPTPIPVRAGDNKIFNTANGNQTIRYYNQVEE